MRERRWLSPKRAMSRLLAQRKRNSLTPKDAQLRIKRVRKSAKGGLDHVEA